MKKDYGYRRGIFFRIFPPCEQLLEDSSQMDRTDRKILAELQQDGRLSVTDLAERVGLSLSPCRRR
jgi:hypothetical protein